MQIVSQPDRLTLPKLQASTFFNFKTNNSAFSLAHCENMVTVGHRHGIQIWMIWIQKVVTYPGQIVQDSSEVDVGVLVRLEHESSTATSLGNPLKCCHRLQRQVSKTVGKIYFYYQRFKNINEKN